MSLDNPNGDPSDTQLYGDDSLFADFDPDEFVARHRSQMQPSQPHVESFQSDRKRDWIPEPDDDETRAGPSLKRSHIVSTVPPDDATVTTPPTTTTLITETQSHVMHKTLFDYFGHSSFRTGQLEIISSIVFGRKDAAFFCPTGKGKSLCYQLPPLFMNKIAIIISPLISLMQDQVFKMNSLSVRSTSHRRLATFLGSGQTDSNAETQALQGHYSLVYCTPEKLSGHSFLQALAYLHLRNDSNNICLFAIDESHCVSEWGHDFRPQYRTIGQTLRSHPVLQNIPILALTATAVPRVQRDILSNLYFRPGQSHIVSQTIDRPNLCIHICRKPQGGFKVALASLVQELTSLTDKKSQLAFGSTIIYAPTQNMVDEISYWLQSTLLPQTTHPWVLTYHAGLSLQQRSEAHTNFLVDKTKVIVATVAFGMGIDKPDIRRIIHFGAPGTMEDYYQQIGRCGRDGLESSCTLFCNEADFTAYKSSFYVGALPSHVRTFREESINAFRNFCMNDESCRRAKLLEYFVQPVTFEGGRCGTCDTCKTRSQHASDLERDFADDGARLVLYAISVLKDKSSLTWIENILNGKMVESFRYRSSAIIPQVVQEKIISMKAACTKGRRWPISHFTKGFLPSLVNGGYVQKCDMSSHMSGMKYTVSCT
jgi:ATP-dependent DNA helicase RecQ/Werner syndrome ATP-dependent helicase